ncbi:MAG: biotin/lipoyl-binding protein [Oscillospiraceae bacterium]|nr:biotin/lipoyl-binding protein [Oscillospiraceae bacterium]
MKKIIALTATAALAVSVTAGCDKSKDESRKLVTTQKVMSDYYDVKLDYQGIVKSKDTKNYSFLSGGRLEKVYVTEGQYVHEGDILAQLDAVELESGAAQSANNRLISENNLNKTEATYLTNITNTEINIRSLQTGLNAIDSNITAYRGTIGAAQQSVDALSQAVETDVSAIEAAKANIEAYDSKLESTRAAVDLAKTNLERIETLYDKGAVAKSELENMQVSYDDAEASYKQAEAQQATNKSNLEKLEASHSANLAQLETSRAQVESMNAQLATLNSQRTQAANQIATANRELENLKTSMNADVGSQEAAEKISQLSSEQAQRAVDNATITADADGYVMAVTVKDGEMTGVGTPVVIVKSDVKIVSIGVSIDDYSKLDNILGITINGDIEGTIDTISQYPDESTRTYKVDIAFNDDALTMGQIVDVELVTEYASGVFIPIDSVINIDGIDYVYIVNDDETVTRSQVELGEVKDTTVQAKNLTNERIVTSGIKALNDNDKIKEAAGEAK